mgnify:CR=1 FL=1
MNHTESEIDIPIKYYFLLIPLTYVGVFVGYIRYKIKKYIDTI